MSNLHVNWQWKRFEELSLREWHDLLQLRIDVFVVEQNCPYPELDGKDFEAMHVFGQQNGRIVGVARILPPGISYAEVSVGRVATAQDLRGQGMGRSLMRICLEAISAVYGDVPVRISAQTYLTRFYREFDFEDTGNHYLEDGIPHVEMYLKNAVNGSNGTEIHPESG